MAKMTAEEFIQILNESDIDFEIYGYEGILNMLSIYSTYEADKYETHAMLETENENVRRGILGVKKLYDNRAYVLHDALAKRGYYERRS